MTERKTLDVVCLGIFVADVLGKPITQMPAWRQLAVIDHAELQTGGCANNTGTGLARLGLRVGAVGKLGNDGLGDFVLKRLNVEGIDTRGIRREDSVNTSFTFVMIAPDGERAFFHYIGANKALTYDDVDFAMIGEARVLHVAGSLVLPGIDGEPTARIFKRAKEMGIITCLDTVYNDSLDVYRTLKPSLEFADYFLPSIDEARLMTNKESPEDVAEFLLDHGVGTVGLKMGPEGSYVRSKDSSVHIPAYKVDVVDTTGAGDAWVAGFLAGIVQGWDLEKSARLGSATGAMCVQAIGTTAGLRGMDETLALMNNTPYLE